MTTKKYLALVLITLIAISVKSQVKIGATTAPNSFSALEIENIGKGLRLPQLTNAQKDYLTSEIESNSNIALAGGLLIYNKNSRNIEMWRDENSKWVSLPMSSRCTVAKDLSITAQSSLILDEYGTEDLVLEATTVGSSSNADLFFEWFLNDKQIADGKIYEVPKNRLSFRDAGSYTVRVISCSNTASAEAIMSAPVVVTINEL